MTDRQTDGRSTNWCVTGFNDDILLLEDVKSYPSFVKKVTGQREICPDTGKLHFQGHIQLHTQQRMSAIKKWLPTAHLEITRNITGSLNYVVKSETAVDGTKVDIKNSRPFIDNQSALMMLARVEVPNTEEWQTDKSFWFRVKTILRQEPHLCGLLGKPDLYRLWKHTWEVWLEKATEESIVLQTPIISEGLSINGQESEACNEEESG